MRVHVCVRPTSGPVWSVCVLRSVITWHSFTPRAALALSCIQKTKAANITRCIQQPMKRNRNKKEEREKNIVSRRRTSEQLAALTSRHSPVCSARKNTLGQLLKTEINKTDRPQPFEATSARHLRVLFYSRFSPEIQEGDKKRRQGVGC